MGLTLLRYNRMSEVEIACLYLMMKVTSISKGIITLNRLKTNLTYNVAMEGMSAVSLVADCTGFY